MDAEQRSFIEIFRRFLEEVVHKAQRDQTLTPIGEVIQEFIRAEISTIPVVTESIAGHRLVDADLALEHLALAEGSKLLGVSHGQMRYQEELPGLLSHPYAPFAPAPVDYVSIPIGPAEERQVVSFGVRLLRFREAPVVVLQRAAQPQFGQPRARLEILAADADVASALIREVRGLMIRLSVLRGKVLSLTGNEYGQGAAGATFLLRPTVAAEEVVLARGTLEAITRHVIGIGEHRSRLIDAGQHLKRGVLLYGPPGTGKTLTVRHLLARTPDTTAVLLTGPSIQFITEAAEIARAMQPAIVVLEDVDLVAGDRMIHHGPQPLLFAVLDALDGLDGDADVTFLLTTNRVELLERALAERPGRVDLAVEIPLPDPTARRRLFALYARGLPLSGTAVGDAADRADGVTGSFAKELMRRAVLAAAQDSRDVTDEDLRVALNELLSARESLTRSLLGTRDVPSSDGTASGQYHAGSHEPADGSWRTQTPLRGSAFVTDSAMASSLTISFEESDPMRDGKPPVAEQPSDDEHRRA